MLISRFKVGFILGYAVATLRKSKDADPLIQRLKEMERRVQGVVEWWKELPPSHPAQQAVRRLGELTR